MPRSSDKPDPSTQFQILETQSPPKYQDLLKQGLPAAASVGSAKAMKNKKIGEVKFCFDQDGSLIESGELILPDAVIQAVEQSYRQHEASGAGTAASSGIQCTDIIKQYVELIEVLERNRFKKMRDQNVCTMRSLATRYRKVLNLTHEELEGKAKTNLSWKNKPTDWPSHLIHVDPNNSGKDSTGKPKKKDLLPVLEYLQSRYEEKRAIYQQWYQEVKAKSVGSADVKQEPASPAQPMAVEDGCVPVAELPSDDTTIFNMVLSQCSQQDVNNTLVNVYEYHYEEEKTFLNVQCAQMQPSIPTPVSDMGAGLLQPQPVYYNGDVTLVSQGGSPLSMAPSMGGSTINELKLSQLGLAVGNTGITTHNPDPVAQQMDVRASMKPQPSAQFQVLNDTVYYQKPSGITTQVAQVNNQMECQLEIDLSQLLFDEVDVNHTGLAETVNLMQQNPPQIHQMQPSIPTPVSDMDAGLLQPQPVYYNGDVTLVSQGGSPLSMAPSMGGSTINELKLSQLGLAVGNTGITTHNPDPVAQQMEVRASMKPQPSAQFQVLNDTVCYQKPSGITTQVAQVNNQMECQLEIDLSQLLFDEVDVNHTGLAETVNLMQQNPPQIHQMQPSIPTPVSDMDAGLLQPQPVYYNGDVTLVSQGGSSLSMAPSMGGSTINELKLSQLGLAVGNTGITTHNPDPVAQQMDVRASMKPQPSAQFQVLNDTVCYQKPSGITTQVAQVNNQMECQLETDLSQLLFDEVDVNHTGLAETVNLMQQNPPQIHQMQPSIPTPVSDMDAGLLQPQPVYYNGDVTLVSQGGSSLSMAPSMGGSTINELKLSQLGLAVGNTGITTHNPDPVAQQMDVRASMKPQPSAQFQVLNDTVCYQKPSGITTQVAQVNNQMECQLETDLSQLLFDEVDVNHTGLAETVNLMQQNPPQIHQMQPSIPTPVSDMGAGLLQPQPVYYNGDVTLVSQGGSSLSMAPSMGGSTINELKLSQLGLAVGNTGITTHNPDPVAQQMDVHASMKPQLSAQFQVLNDTVCYQKPSGITTQVAQVNIQMECQPEIDLSQFEAFDEVDVNRPRLAETANLMQQNQPQIHPMQPSIPTPVSDMGAGLLQPQPVYYNGDVTLVSQGGSSLSMAPSMGGSTINELKLSQLGLAVGNTGITTHNPDPVAQQMDVHASMKPQPSAQFQVLNDTVCYQKPSGITTQVAQVNIQMECQPEIDLSQFEAFDEVDVNRPRLAETANLMQQNQPQIHPLLHADLRWLPVPSETPPRYLLQHEEDMDE